MKDTKWFIRLGFAFRDKYRAIDADSVKHAAVDDDDMVHGGTGKQVATEKIQVVVGKEIGRSNHRAITIIADQLNATLHEQMVRVKLE